MYKRGKYQRITTKTIFIITALLLLSIAAHLAGFVGLRNIAGGGRAGITGQIIPVVLVVIGIVLLCLAIFKFQPSIRFGDVIRPLCYLAIAYIIIQLILSLVMGGIAVLLDSGSLSGSKVKQFIDLLIRIIQIPIHSGAMLFFIEIVTGQTQRFGRLFFKTMGAYGIYTVVQYLLGMTGHGPILIIVRILIGSGVTAALWYYIYNESAKAGDHHEA